MGLVLGRQPSWTMPSQFGAVHWEICTLASIKYDSGRMNDNNTGQLDLIRQMEALSETVTTPGMAVIQI